MWRFLLVVVIWFTMDVQRLIVADNLSMESLLKYAREKIPDIKVDNGPLIKQWQDWALANCFTANYLSILLVYTSRQDFPWIIPAEYTPKYVQNPDSFFQTISQLSTAIRITLTNAREDLNRVHTGMNGVPDELQTIHSLLRLASYDLLVLSLPNSVDKFELLVNNSLIVLRKPKETFKEVLNLVTEIDLLRSVTPMDSILALQISDVKTEWTFLTELINQLAEQAEKARESFTLQFNWIFNEMLQPGSPFDESIRNFILRILLPKIIEIDQTSDLLGIVTQTYTDISSEYTDQEIGGNAHLILLTNETVRKEYLREFRYELPPLAVQFARLALTRHLEFLQRDQKRGENYT